MGNLIDYTVFTGSLRLPFSANSQDIAQMNELITEKQDEYLKYILGDVETLKLKTELGTGSTATSQKWIDFLQGCTLTVNDINGLSKNVEYKGFKYILKYFIYYEYLRNYSHQMTSSGNVQQLNENSTPVSYNNKAVTAFMDAQEMYGVDWNNDFWQYNNYTYLQIYGLNNVYREQIKGTAYNYLHYKNKADSTNFPDWIFTELQNVNAYNI